MFAIKALIFKILIIYADLPSINLILNLVFERFISNLLLKLYLLFKLYRNLVI